MSIEVKIPPMGESITSGVLAKWHVSDGDLVKKDQPLFELLLDRIDGRGYAFLRHDEVLSRVDKHLLLDANRFATDRIDDRKLFDLVPPEFDPQGELLVRRPQLDAITAHPELGPCKLDVVARRFRSDGIPLDAYLAQFERIKAAAV